MVTGGGNCRAQHGNERCRLPSSLSRGHAHVCIGHPRIRDIQVTVPVPCSGGRTFLDAEYGRAPHCHSPCEATASLL